MRRRERQAGQFVSVSVVLDRDQAAVLDGLVENLGVSREDVLKRGLFLLDTSHLLMAAPANATIMVGVEGLDCPKHGWPAVG